MLAPHKTYGRVYLCTVIPKDPQSAVWDALTRLLCCDGEAANVLKWAAPTVREQVPAGATTAALSRHHPDSHFTSWKIDFMFFSPHFMGF